MRPPPWGSRLDPDALERARCAVRRKVQDEQLGRKLNMPQEDLILRMVNVSKEFPGVLALADVNFGLRKGEIHALVGENGAGKSTLIKILAGIYKMSSGEILWEGKRVEITDPTRAQQLGFAFVHQDLNLIPSFTVYQNIFLSRERTSLLGMIKWREMRQEAANLLKRFEIDIDLEEKVGDLGVAQQQLVALARALALEPRLIVFDEPTAPLSREEVERLGEVIRNLKGSGVAVIYISHRLEEISQLCDRVTVLRDGKVVGTVPGDTDLREIIRMMIGTQIGDKFYKEKVRIGEPILEVRGLTRPGRVEEISFVLHRGEVLGIGGLLGAGRSELVRLIFGADPMETGQILLGGKPVEIRSPSDAIAHGIALVPENRREQGIVVDMTVRENVTLANLHKFCRLGFILDKPEVATVNGLVHDVGIKTSGIDQDAKHLSGGNQQKVVIAKWLCSHASVFLFDEPTKGLDVGAKVEIYHLIGSLVEEGAGVVMVSPEIPELLGLCDRIMVMRRGRKVAELSADNTSQEEVLAYAAGAQAESEI